MCTYAKCAYLLLLLICHYFYATTFMLSVRMLSVCGCVLFTTANRYTLYISYACPWANRCLAVLKLKASPQSVFEKLHVMVFGARLPSFA